jgi:hypothetical protein
MKKLYHVVVLSALGLCVLGCQEEKKSVQAAMWCKADATLISTAVKQPSLREELRFLENEKLYYGMEAERSRMTQARSQGAFYSMGSLAAGTAQNSY